MVIYTKKNRFLFCVVCRCYFLRILNILFHHITYVSETARKRRKNTVPIRTTNISKPSNVFGSMVSLWFARVFGPYWHWFNEFCFFRHFLKRHIHLPIRRLYAYRSEINVIFIFIYHIYRFCVYIVDIVLFFRFVVVYLFRWHIFPSETQNPWTWNAVSHTSDTKFGM